MKKNLILLFFLILSIGIKAQIAFGTQDTLTTMARVANKVTAADIDGDGILDAVVSSTGAGIEAQRLAWFKNNNDGNKKFADCHIIDDHAFYDVNAADIDGNGTIDVLALEKGNYSLVWFSNDGSGNFSSEKLIQVVTTSISIGIVDIELADIDGDNDLDVILSHYNAKFIAWYENTSGDGSAWTEHIINNNEYIRDFSVSDLDNDGDLDIIAMENDSAGVATKRVVGYENDGNAVFTYHAFDSQSSNLICVNLVDLNNDNLIDIVFSIEQSTTDSARIAWYENQGNGDFSAVKNIFAISASSGIYSFTDI